MAHKHMYLKKNRLQCIVIRYYFSIRLQSLNNLKNEVMENLGYKLGNLYTDLLTVDNDYNKTTTRVTKVTPKKYGYSIQMFNHYITMFYIKLVINEDGSAKAFYRVEKNYYPTQRYTVYYSPEKREIICPENKGERSVYNQLRKQITK